MSVATRDLERPAPPGRIVRAAGFWQNAIGKKFFMALTGIVLFIYVAGHLAGNLQIYSGREAINAYARFLHSHPVALVVVRCILFAAVFLHIVAAIPLYLQKWRARRVRYHGRRWVEGKITSRTMLWSGLLIGAFVVYHLLNLTTGTIHPEFRELDPYDNMVLGFRVVPSAVAYLVAMVGLGFHLQHGLWSMFQSLGAGNPRFIERVKQAALLVAVLVFLGFVSIPVAVLTGLVG